MTASLCYAALSAGKGTRGRVARMDVCLCMAASVLLLALFVRYEQGVTGTRRLAAGGTFAIPRSRLRDRPFQRGMFLQHARRPSF